jgi:sec-independent protein translocase protein TatC
MSLLRKSLPNAGFFRRISGAFSGMTMATEERQYGFNLMGLGDHLDELRVRVIRAVIGLVVAVVITTCFGGYLFQFLCEPFYQARVAANLPPVLWTMSSGEGMILYFKVTMLFGVILAAPWIFWQFWQFVYPKEKRYVYVLAPLSAALFMTGALLFIKVVAFLTIRYLIQFDVGIDYVKVECTLANHINFMMMMSLVFGVGFQLPLLVVGLNKLGIFPVTLMNKWRKYVILVLVIVAAVLTSDPLSLTALAVPLYLLFEISVLFCWWTQKKGPGNRG